MVASHSDRRLAGRLDCQLPIRLTAGTHVVHATSENISRVGVLLRIPLAELGLEDEASLGVIGVRLTQVLGERATAEFRYDTLGRLICRTVRLVRLAGAPVGDGSVLVGCAMPRALTDEEAGILQLSLPPFLGLQPEEQPAAGDPAQEIGVVLCSAHATPVRPLLGTARELSAQGMRALCQDLRPLSSRTAERGVGALVGTLERGYGTLPTVVLMREGRPRWSGAARIRTAEFDADRDGLDLQLEFAALLSVPDMASLGVCP
jgi:YD repeat-containing protein